MTVNMVAYTQRLVFKTLLEIECKGLTGFAPVIKDSAEDFSTILEMLGDVDVVVIDAPPVENDFQALLKIVDEKKKRIKHVLLLTLAAPGGPYHCFAPGAAAALINQLKQILNPQALQTMAYISIPAKSFVHFKFLPFDLYIKLGETKYVKRVPANEQIDEATIRTLQSKGINELYFDKRYNREFSQLLLNNMINKVEGKNISPVAQAKATNEVFMTTKEIVQSIGLPPRVIEVCESVMERITADVTQGKDKFSTYLTDMKRNPDLSFQFRLVELTSYIATQILETMNISNKADLIKKVVFASFFCDISLKESSYLHYRSEDDLKELWSEDKKEILEHALKASEIVKKYKNAPADVAEIVRQHHGSASGIGFPKLLPDNMLPMAKCLMASQELAFALLKNPEINSPTILNQLIQRFANTPLHLLLERFESTCRENKAI